MLNLVLILNSWYKFNLGRIYNVKVDTQLVAVCIIKFPSFSEGYAMQAYQQNNDVLPENWRPP